jgi:hypothetical protein
VGGGEIGVVIRQFLPMITHQSPTMAATLRGSFPFDTLPV